MARNANWGLNSLADEVAGWFPKLSKEEQQLSLQLYRLLAQGSPVSPEQLAARLALPPELVLQTLRRWPGVFYDERERVIGYWGLALPEMAHRFTVNGRRLYTWCAWDSLFLPELIGETARVESTCPVTGTVVRLVVSPQAIIEMDPAGAVMSFLTPDAARVQEDVIIHFCHFVHFFRSAEAGQRWVSEHDGTFLLSMQDASILARRKNAIRYRDTVLIADQP
ncbi:MAG: alkylmercury lyase [Nitrospirae bacterium]|nr:alkylmercury lyase [Nitrospirota bacterium]